MRGKSLALLYNQVTMGVEPGQTYNEDYTLRPYRFPDSFLDNLSLGWLSEP